MLYLYILFFFFFQAEDGIRDWSVTGVQTCALPSHVEDDRADPRCTPLHDQPVSAGPARARRQARPLFRQRAAKAQGDQDRSEERRVGKECKSQWGTGR